MRPKIAIVGDYPADHMTFTGGVATATAALLEGLRPHQDEFEFHLVSTSTTLDQDVHEVRDGFTFHFLSIPRTRWTRPRLLLRVVRTYQEFRRIRPVVVHGQASMLGLAAIMFGQCAFVHTVHGILRQEAKLRTGWDSWAAYAMLPLEQFLLRRCDALVCISEYAARTLGCGSHCFRIPNAVGGLFLDTPRRERPDSLNLVFTGVLAPIKRPMDLVLAHELLRRSFPTLRTSVCGPVQDVSYARHLKQVIAERHIQGIELLGPLSRPDLAALLSQATALVLPSAQENTPMVIAEAMAVGVPVVASLVGGVSEMVHHGETGLLYRAGDVAELTSALELTLSDAGLRRRLGDQASRWARDVYSPARVGDATVAVYRQLLGANERPDSRLHPGLIVAGLSGRL